MVRTVPLELDTATHLVDLLPQDSPLAWLRRGEGLVGWGIAARIDTDGPTRFSDADKWWAETTSRAVIRDDINIPGLNDATKDGELDKDLGGSDG